MQDVLAYVLWNPEWECLPNKQGLRKSVTMVAEKIWAVEKLQKNFGEKEKKEKKEKKKRKKSLDPQSSF